MLDIRNPLAPSINGGNGLVLTVNSGVLTINNAPLVVPKTIFALTASATNFVYIDSNGSLTVNTSGFPAGSMPIATAITNGNQITSLVDNRPDFTIPSSGGGSTFTYFANFGGIAASTGTNLIQNTVQLSGFTLPVSVQFSKIIFRNGGGSDLGNSYDVGIYDSTGTLKAHTGVFGFPTPFVDLSVGGTVTLSAGKYYLGVTTNAAAPAANVANAPFSVGQVATFLLTVNTATASSGGVLPNSLTPPADSWSFGTTVHGFTLHN